MKILIIGAGEVGYKIAGRLVAEGHDVTMLERAQEVLQRATDHLDIQGLRGQGARPDVLDEAGIAEVDMLVAATNSDEVNIVACLNAAILGKEKIIKIARVRDPSYLDPRIFDSERVSIDLAINPERVTADQLLELLPYPGTTEMIHFADGHVRIVGLRIKPTNPLAGLRLVDVRDRFKEPRPLIAAIHRGSEVIIPCGSDVILPGDEIYLSVLTKELPQLLSALGVKVNAVSRVMIAGGSKVGRFLAEALSKQGLKPKLVEPDLKLAQWLGDELPEAVILHGSPTDAELLEQENAGEMQAFIACGRDEEANVMSALLAMRLGASRVLATTNRGDYLPLMRSIGIDVCISPRQVAVDSILHFIRHGRVLAARALGEEYEAEALEFIVHAESEAVGRQIKEMRIPSRVMIVCIQRGDEVIIPRGETKIEEGDHVLVVACRASIRKVEALLDRACREGRK